MGRAIVDVTERLSTFAHGLAIGDIQPAAVHETKRATLNYLGLAIAGTCHPTSDVVLQLGTSVGSAATSTVLGRAERLDPLWAAMVNGVAAHVEDFDDTHLATLIHPGAPVLSAVIGACTGRDVDGPTLIAASAAGIEVALRVGLGLGIGHWERGYHLTSTCGVLGAAAGASRILGSVPAQAEHAIGVASSQASGVLGMLGTDTKSLHAGKAAADGLLSAYLAHQGITAAGIDVPRGYAEALSPTQDYNVMVSNLGSEWHLLDNTYKPFACGVVAHPAMEGVITLASDHDLSASDVERIEIATHASVLRLMGEREPRTSLQAKFSVFHCAAVSLLDRTGGVEQFSQERVTAPDVAAVRELISITLDPSLSKEEAKVAIVLKNGKELTEHVASVRGSLAQPLTDAELESKFTTLASQVLPATRVSELTDAVWNLDRATSVDSLLSLTIPD